MKPAATQIQSVSRAARLLLAAARSDAGVGPTEAAGEVGCSVPAAHHLLSTLRAEGLLVQNAERRFAIGPATVVLAEAWLRRDRVPGFLLESLRALAAQTGETAYLAAWRDGVIRVLAAVEGTQAVRAAGAELGVYERPHARASGKLLLAFADDERRAATLGSGPLDAATARTITSREALDEAFARIRERGYAEDDEEFADGVRCLAAPVLVDGAVIASLCVAAPASRLDQARDSLLDAVLRAAATAASGGRHHQTTEEAA